MKELVRKFSEALSDELPASFSLPRLPVARHVEVRSCSIVSRSSTTGAREVSVDVYYPPGYPVAYYLRLAEHITCWSGDSEVSRKLAGIRWRVITIGCMPGHNVYVLQEVR